MKICGIICEFNPFHNGHKYLLERAKVLSGCDKMLCIMSGSFTQRGDICVLDKYTRAKHALLGGADAVLELPTAFSVAPAEIFARGAIKILSAIPDVCALAFGCENAEKEQFLRAAQILTDENEQFKSTLRDELASGESYIKSYATAFAAAGGNEELLKKPNNILGVEYTKALLKVNSKIEIFPVKRVGAGFSDGEMKENFSSASAIRSNISSPLIKNNVPDFVLNDLRDFSSETDRFNDYVRLVLTRTDAETLKRVYGCGEGLENKLKSLEKLSYEEISGKATSKRYSSTRIKRILCANFLGLYRDDCERFLNAPLYLKPLAIKHESADLMLAALAKSDFPTLIKGRDKLNLSQTVSECLKKDEFAYLQWKLIAQNEVKNNDFDGLKII